MISLLAAVLLGQTFDPRLATAFREDRAGWVYAHLEGDPEQIGFQYGSLLAPEIDDTHRSLRETLKRDTGKDWSYYRETSKKLFWAKVDGEYQKEIEGQAEGLQSKGLTYDKWDVLAMNAYIEVSEYYLPWSQDGHPGAKESCSAFIATGDETADGKIVMGHNLWWDYQMGQRFKAVLDVTPKTGHRFLMDAMCGFIHSGSDFAINDAGMIICETTLPSLKDFDPNGIPEFVRMRKATQYSSSLDDFVRTMKAGNNGGYPNTWLIGDIKTNEIGRLELGLKNVNFDRAKNGYFAGANFPQNPQLIASEVQGWDPNPLTNGCEARKRRWKELLDENKGTVDAVKAQKFLGDVVDYRTGKPGHSLFQLCGETIDWGANNAKVVTADMAKSMSFWGRMGFPDGYTLTFPAGHSAFLHDIRPQPWTLFTAKSKPKTGAGTESGQRG